MYNDAEMKKEKIGLALGGGGARGSATLAIIKELESLNLKFDYISGTSVGAIIGAYYALYGEIDSLVKEVLSFKKLELINFFDFSLFNKKSIIQAKKYTKYLKGKFGDKTFKDTKIPLVVVTTNIQSGEVEYLNHGKILDAVLASSAFPIVFPPYKIDGKILMDGGILNNLPFEILFKEKMNKVIAINLCMARKDKTKFNNIFSVATRVIDLMIDNAFKRKSLENKNLFIFKPEIRHSSFNFSNILQIYNIGLKEFNNKKDSFIKWLG